MASFDENGKYIKTNWKAGDKITATKLNKIEESIEAVNDNDISRHVEADARLDALEAKDVAHDKEFTNVKYLIANNKAAAELGDYEIISRMTLLENEFNEGIEELNNVASTVDGKIATAEANMAAQVNQGKVDMEVMFAEVEEDLDRLHVKDEELSEQLTTKANIFKISQSDSFEYIKNVLENNDNCKIIFENGNYLFDSEILIKNKQGLNIDFSNSTITVGELEPLKSILKLDSCSNIIISNGNLNGNRAINGQNTGVQDGGNHGISIRDCCCIHVRNCKIYDCGSDGVYIGRLTGTNESANTDIHLINCTMDNNMRQGVSIISLSNSSFINCNFINTNGKSPQAGIDIEPNSFEVIRNLQFKECKFNGNNGRGFMVDDRHASTVTSLSFEQCVFTDNNQEAFVFNLDGIAQEAHKIYLNKCNIDLIYSSGTDTETLLYINDCTIGTSCIVKNMYANICTSKMTILSMQGGQVVVDNCLFDGENKTDAIDWVSRTNDVDLSIIRNCVFKNYNRWFLGMANNSIVENCIFLTEASEEHASMSQAIEPANRADINLLIKDCIFKRKPIRFPSQTTGVTVLNCGSIVEWATSTTNTVVNCYKF